MFLWSYPYEITIDKSNVHAKGHGQRSMVKITEVKTHFASTWAFPGCNSSLNLQMATKWCINLKWYRRRVHLISDVVRQVSTSHGIKKNHQFSPKLGISGLQLGCYIRSALLFLKVIRKISKSHGTEYRRFEPNCVLPSCNSSLNWLMPTKWGTSLKVAQKGCLIVFQGHPSNFKVKWDIKMPFFWPKLSIFGL